MYIVFYLYREGDPLGSKRLYIKEIKTPQREVEMVRRYENHPKLSLYVVGRFPTLARAQDKYEALKRAKAKRMGYKTTKEKILDKMAKDKKKELERRPDFTQVSGPRTTPPPKKISYEVR